MDENKLYKNIVLLLLILGVLILIFIYLHQQNETIQIISMTKTVKKEQQTEICVDINAGSYPSHILRPIDYTLQTNDRLSQYKCPTHSIEHILNNSNIKDSESNCKVHLISDAIENIKCMSSYNMTTKLLQENIHSVIRYQQRAEESKCANGEFGMWLYAGLAQQKCYFLLGMSRISNLKPNQLVLDWGAGCGHQIFWLYQYFGAFGVGLDLIDGNKQYAMNTFHKNGPLVEYCSGDASDLSFLSNNSFQHIYSIAGVYHIEETDKQCSLILNHFIRLLKPGGTIWMGWNGADSGAMKMNDWEECLRKYDQTYGKIQYQMFYDLQIFNFTIYMDWSTRGEA
eukprot:175386_1